MTITIFLGNAFLAGFVLLAGFLYPSVMDWSHLATGLVGFYLLLELLIAQIKLLDPAKISVWTVNALSSIISIALLLPYKLGWGDWWALLAALVTGGAVLVSAIVINAFRPNGVADLQPKTNISSRDTAK